MRFVLGFIAGVAAVFGAIVGVFCWFQFRVTIGL